MRRFFFWPSIYLPCVIRWTLQLPKDPLKMFIYLVMGAQWLSGRVLESRPRGRGFELHRRHCVVSLSKTINPSLVLVQPRNICPFTTERLLMGRKESNQTNKLPGKTETHYIFHCLHYNETGRVQPILRKQLSDSQICIYSKHKSFSVKQFGSRAGLIFCQILSGS